MSLAKYEKLWSTAYGSFVNAIRRIAPKELSNIANSDIAVYCLLTDIIKVWGCFAMEIMGWDQVAD